MLGQMGDDGGGVVACPVDETGVAAVLERLSDDVQTRAGGDAATLLDRPVRTEHGDSEPTEGRPVAGRRDDRRDPSRAEVDRGDRLRQRHRWWTLGRQDLGSQPSRCDVVVDAGQQSLEPGVGTRDRLGEVVTETCRAMVDPVETADQLHATVLERGQVDGTTDVGAFTCWVRCATTVAAS